MSHGAGTCCRSRSFGAGAPPRKFHRQFALARGRSLASALLPVAAVEITTNGRERTPRQEDMFDALLRWVNRLLNPPRPTPAPAPTGRHPRRVRDRVPL